MKSRRGGARRTARRSARRVTHARGFFRRARDRRAARCAREFRALPNPPHGVSSYMNFTRRARLASRLLLRLPSLLRGEHLPDGALLDRRRRSRRLSSLGPLLPRDERVHLDGSARQARPRDVIRRHPTPFPPPLAALPRERRERLLPAPGASTTARACRTAVFCLTCEKTCVTSPAYRCASPASRSARRNPGTRSASTNARAAAAFSSASASTRGMTTDGNSHKPPRSPPSGRRTRRNAEAPSACRVASTANAATDSSRRFAFFAFSGNDATSKGSASDAVATRARARAQCSFTGHASQSGFLGAHTVAPNSIIAWL